MSITRNRHGSQPRDLVRLDTKITPELDHAMNELVIAAGVSKASLVRAALAQYLAARGVLPPDHPDLIEPTPTRGPGLAIQKENR